MNADAFYARVLSLFEGRETRDSLRIAAKLILALAEELDNEEAIGRALSAAKEETPLPPDFASMVHFGYFRSSSDYRLRIALNLKRIDIPRCYVGLRKGEQNNDYRRAKNSAGLVPALSLCDGGVLAQSMVLIEYLNVLAPQPDLLPGDALQQAKIRAFAQAVACDIQPLGNLRVLNQLRAHGLNETAIVSWLHRWMGEGFVHLEERAAQWRCGKYLFGAQPTLAEICLIPQMYNARRYKLDLSAYPLLCEIEEICLAHRAFRDTAPENQPDAESA